MTRKSREEEPIGIPVALRKVLNGLELGFTLRRVGRNITAGIIYENVDLDLLGADGESRQEGRKVMLKMGVCFYDWGYSNNLPPLYWMRPITDENDVSHRTGDFPTGWKGEVDEIALRWVSRLRSGREALVIPLRFFKVPGKMYFAVLLSEIINEPVAYMLSAGKNGKLYVTPPFLRRNFWEEFNPRSDSVADALKRLLAEYQRTALSLLQREFPDALDLFSLFFSSGFARFFLESAFRVKHMGRGMVTSVVITSGLRFVSAPWLLRTRLSKTLLN